MVNVLVVVIVVVVLIGVVVYIIVEMVLMVVDIVLVVVEVMIVVVCNVRGTMYMLIVVFMFDVIVMFLQKSLPWLSYDHIYDLGKDHCRES